jgi:hypothetical protein
MVDTDFPFGANDPEVTAIVTDSDSIAWRDIESLRRAARADVATVADAHWTRALSYVARLREPALRSWASRWLAYCTVGGARPVRHAGEAGKACRRVELELARVGVIDPEGFEACERIAPKRKAKGVFRGVAGQLAADMKRWRYRAARWNG